MKPILYIFTLLVFLTSCKSSKDYLSRSDEDKTLYDIVKKLNKRSNDENAINALPAVYKQLQQKHLKKIAVFSSYKDLGRWDQLNNEYSILQNMYEAISNSDASGRLVNPVSYQNELSETKKLAAEDYYQLGESYLKYNTRVYAKKAYAAFKKSDNWVRDYKDSKFRMDEAFNSSIINILINPIQDNSFFLNTAGWGNTGYNYSNEYFQQNLVRDLGGKYTSRYPARYYTEGEARQDNIQPDWVVDLTLRNMDIPRPALYNYERNASKKIENGKDSSGKPVYITVHAALHIKRQSFTARAQMDLNIIDVASRKNITYNSYSDTYYWQQEYATFTGDKRALSNDDLTLLNNDKYDYPRREEILNQLYRNIYPQVKSRIIALSDW